MRYTVIIRLTGLLLGIVVSAWLLQQLVKTTLRKEGFADAAAAQAAVEPEERMSPQVFSYNLLQAVKGPIQRLGVQLTDVGMWKNRIESFNMDPVQLARRELMGKHKS